MKTTSLIVVAGMLAFAGATQAEEAKPKPKKGPAPEILEKYDTDKDGTLSKEEKAAWTKDKKAAKANKPKKQPKPIDPALLEKYDANKDGKLCKKEKAAMKKDMPKPEKKPKPSPAPKPEKQPKPEKSKGPNPEDIGP